MNIRNKVIATIYLDDGCSQDDGEASISWRPVNFDIYNELFPDLIIEAVNEWLLSKRLIVNMSYELILAHEIDRDKGGAVLGESFVVIHDELQQN